jgi:hypothetical protein
MFLIEATSPLLMERSMDYIAKKARDEECDKRCEKNGQHV